MNKINWFPGHMSKTVNKLKELKYIDLIVEIVDARALHISSNPEILKLFPNVLKTTIALKSDLSDVAGFKEGLLCSIHDKNIIKKIIALFDHVLDNKIQSYKRKGLVNPQFYILVVGLPNVGKSTLINKLKGKRTLIAQNRPGVTRTEQLIKINERYLMYDTPGIMVKNIVKITDGYILSLLNVIKNDILPYETILA
jgi:ribosome biogenesis GTPase A